MGRFYIEEKISEHIGETPEGFLICYDVPVAKIGEQTYKGDEVPIEPNKDGLVLIKRTEDEVFKPEAISSFEGKPFTIDHPDEMVTPENWKELAHGFITNVRRGVKEKIDLLVGDIVVTTKKAIELVKNGMREISCGYDADYEQLDTGLGIQKNIIGNHIALVMRGRAGHRCAIGDKDKVCTGCGKCNCKNTKDKEDENDMKIKQKLSKAYRKLIKDEDFKKLPDDEKADKLAELASDEIEEEKPKEGEEPINKDQPEGEEEIVAPENEGGEGEGEEEIEEKPSEEKITIGMLNNNINRLIGIIEAFVKAAAGNVPPSGDSDSVNTEGALKKENEPFVNDDGGGSLPPSGGLPKIGGNSPIRTPSASDEEPDEKEKETEDEDSEEKEKEKQEDAKTCDSMFHDIAFRADLLLPGIKVVKPTKDHMKFLDKIKVKALKSAFTSDAEVVESIVKGEDIDKLDRKGLHIAFVAVSNAIKERNNRFVKDSVITNTNSSVSTIRDMNQRHKEFWGRK